MSIRIPPRADGDLRNSLLDVQGEIDALYAELKKLREAPTAEADLRREIEALKAIPDQRFTNREQLIKTGPNIVASRIIASAATGLGLSPDNFSGLQGWWKADAGVFSDAGTTPAADTNTVQQWNDQSGNARHFSQATATNRPTYRTNIVNGKPVIRFDGVDNMMNTASGTFNNMVTDTAATIFVVAYIVTVTTAGANAYDNDQVFTDTNKAGGGSGVRNCLGLRTTPDARAFHFDGTSDVATKSEAVTGAWKIFLHMRGSGNVYLGINDARDASLASGATGSTSALANRVLQLGADFTDAIFTELDVAEVSVHNTTLSESDRQQIETHYANKYGITLPYTITEYGNVDILRVEDDSGNSIFRVSNLGDVYVGATKLNVP